MQSIPAECSKISIKSSEVLHVVQLGPHACGNHNFRMAHYSFIERALVKFFYRYGKVVARYPLAFLLGSLLVAGGLTSGLMFIDLETEAAYLFTPDKSQAKTDTEIVDKLFPVNYTEYLWSRGKDIPDDRANVIILPKGGDNVLTEEALSEILRFDEEVRNLSVTSNNTTLKYSDLCASWQGSCHVDPVLDAYNYNASYANVVDLTHPVYVSRTMEAIFLGASLPDVTVDEYSVIESASICSLSYYLQSSPEMTKLSLQWEDEFIDYAKSFESDSISIYYIVSESIDNELKDLTYSVIPNFIIACGLLITFSVGTCFMADWVLSKIILAILGLLSAMLAVGASSGLMSFFHIQANLVVAAMPFLVVGKLLFLVICHYFVMHD